MIDKIRKYLTGFRKFSIVLIIIGVCIWFRLANLMSGDNIAEVFTGVGAAFMGANLIEHITDVIKKKLDK